MLIGYYFIIAAFHCSLLQNANGQMRNKNKGTYDPIVFPGPTNALTNRHGEVEDDVPPECMNQTYCSIKPKNYPQELIDNMFKSTQPTSPVLILTENRDGDIDELTGCDSVVTYEPMYRVRNAAGWYKVAQSPKQNYLQMVRIEKCSGEAKPCFERFVSQEFESFCKETTTKWEFLVLKPDESGTEKVNIELPICCSCHYRRKQK